MLQYLIMWQSILKLVYQQKKSIIGYMRKLCVMRNAAPLNYEGFPKSVCTSVNEVVCHGIPSEDEILKDGDIVNVDVSTIYNGYFSDFIPYVLYWKCKS